MTIIFLFFLSYFIYPLSSKAESSNFPEGKIKAAYLFNFLRFVEWPSKEFEENKICVIGQKKEYNSAISLLRTQYLNKKPIYVRKLNDSDSVIKSIPSYQCQIIFVTSEASDIQKTIINSIKGSPTLTVGEDKNFNSNGGMINFITIEDKIRFEINLAAANEEKIRITSKILRIATNVTE